MATRKLMMLSVTAATMIIISTPAMADVKSKDVHYSDLDLSSPAGRERLQVRIRQAVKQVCGSPRAFAIKERQDIIACTKQANLKAAPESAQIIAAYMEKRRTIESTASVAAR